MKRGRVGTCTEHSMSVEALMKNDLEVCASCLNLAVARCCMLRAAVYPGLVLTVSQLPAGGAVVSETATGAVGGVAASGSAIGSASASASSGGGGVGGGATAYQEYWPFWAALIDAFGTDGVASSSGSQTADAASTDDSEFPSEERWSGLVPPSLLRWNVI